MEDIKTRREKKGTKLRGDKQSTCYSQKAIRAKESLLARKARVVMTNKLSS